MKRRDFLSQLFSPNSASSAHHRSHPKPTALTIDPYSSPLSTSDVYHLLRRVSFGPTHSLVQHLVNKTAMEAVDLLLGDPQNTPTVSPPGEWVDQSTENPRGADIDTRRAIESWWKNIFRQFQNWWANRMLMDSIPAIEKIVLFWHGHFTTEFTYENGYIPPQLLWRQYLMFRKNRIGSFPQFVEDFTLDGAELVYLGGELNTKGVPNENYARELMELFTMGVGWYTEGDVKEAARVLTGWRVAKFNDEPAPNGIYNVYFDPPAHDTGAKQILGITIPARSDDENTEFLVRRDEIRRLIEILIETRGEQISRFICKKIHRFFIYSDPAYDPPILEDLAAVFRNSNYDLRTVFKTLLSSQYFFDPAFRGVQIKTPADFVIGLARQLELSSASFASIIAELGEEFYDPPTVAGWDGYRTWINTISYPKRIEFARNLIESLSDEHLYQWATKFPSFYEDVDRFATEMEEYFLPRPLSVNRHQRYVAILLQNAQPYEWPEIAVDQSAAALRIRNFLIQMIQAPDFQLC